MFGKIVAASAFACVLAVASAHADDAAAMKQQQEMEMWAKMAAPGAPHAELAKLAGTWNTIVTMWMEPGAEPQVSKGVSDNKMVLDGRWLEQRYTGDFMGQPFQGVGFTGYDNVRQKYRSVWMDDMSTTMVTSEGDADTGGYVITLAGDYACAMTGEKHKAATEIIRIVSHDKYVFEMHDPKRGENSKTMEITYTRK